jgi:hypothetical protein
LNNYQTNFNSGGWNAFLINTQYPQNNYLGYNMQMSNITYEQTTANSKKSSVPTLAQKAQTILSQGSGFLSPSKCPTNINASYNTMTNEFNPPTFTPDTSTLPKIPDCIPNTVEQQNLDGSSTAVTAAGCQNQSLIDQAKAQYTTVLSNEQSAFNMTTGCVDPKTGKSALVATTPGAVVGSQITNALASNGHATELDAALGNSISVILNALMNHFLQKGLSEISSVVQSAPSIDTWNYNGLSLTGNNTTGANTTGGIIVPTNVSLAVGSTSPQPISGGTAPYTATSNFPDTATVKISGSTISVTGVSQGTALITITDSSSPVKVAVIAATVGGQNGNMMLNFTNTTTNPTSVSVGTGNSVTLTLSGGTQPYSIQTQPNSNIAITQITNSNSLLIAGLAAGNTSVSLEDSAGQTVNLSIAVGTESPLVATPTTVSVTGNGSASSTISGGTPPYSIVTQPTSGTASAFLSGNTLNVTGASTGNTSVTVQDSYSPAETITIPITATAVPSVSPTGSPQNVSVQAGSSTTVNIITSDPTVLPVILTPPTAAIATAQIQNSSILSITGVSAGITSLVIQTSSSNTSAGSTNNVVGNGTTSTTTSSPTTITISITVTPIAGTNTTF